MKTFIQSPVLAALILASAIVWAAHIVANPSIHLAAGQRLATESSIVIQAPNGFHVDVLGAVQIPAELNLKADLRTDPADGR